jgi:nicotinate phosphoribosyltransferase
VIYDHTTDLSNGCTIIDPLDPTRRKKIPADTAFNDLLVPIMRNGECVYETPSIEDVRENAQTNLALFHSSIKRFVNPHIFPVGLEKSLYELKMDLVLKARNGEKAGA